MSRGPLTGDERKPRLSSVQSLPVETSPFVRESEPTQLPSYRSPVQLPARDSSDDFPAHSGDIHFRELSHPVRSNRKGVAAAASESNKNSPRSEEHTSELQSPCNLV